MRRFSKLTTAAARQALDRLLAATTQSDEYRLQMTVLGQQLGAVLSRRIPQDAEVLVACTPEDADFLACGLLGELPESRLAVVWVERGSGTLSDVAHVYKRFVEPRKHGRAAVAPPVLVIVKSIIASSCTVRAGINELLGEVQPEQIHVVAPVILAGAEQRLASEFEPQISKRFQYLWFAEDDAVVGDHVEPGVGGRVYDRLQIDPRSYVPAIVHQRRALQAHRYTRKLELVGVGYHAAMQGKFLNLTLGFSRPLVFEAPEGVTIEVPTQTEILIKGSDKQRVGETAAKIRAFRPLEPYKGKGVRDGGEKIPLKEAKNA